MKRLGWGVRGCIAALALLANTGVICLLMVPFALVKLALPWRPVRRKCDRVLNLLAERWVGNNGAWLKVSTAASFGHASAAALDRRGWYVVTCNHQCWADIFVLQQALHRRTPLLKFFLKRELLYVPVIGLAWWALDFPFMRRRRSGVQASRDDLASAEASCMRFRATPTALLNFVEGTRFTPVKAARQRSPYRHLLKPKAGGMAVALATLGDKLDGLLDVTIVYARGAPTFWKLLSGQVGKVIVRVRRLPLPMHLAQDTLRPDAGYRERVQGWLHELWQEKDRLITAIQVRA